MSSLSSGIRRLPLHAKHAQMQARFGAFGEWEVPLYYTSILEEHEAVRKRAGLFDISHMGEFFLTGPRTEAFLQELLPRDINRVAVGAASYTPLLNERGGIVDDVILYRFGADLFLLIVNAGNVEKDFNWIKPRVPSGVHFENQSEDKGLLALQGPQSAAILKAATKEDFSMLSYYHFREWGGGMIARTGYTGEDGFEIMVDQKQLPEIWDALFRAGTALGLVPAGFGARDTLRLEAAMPLYGHDMNDDTSPFEVGIGWAVDLEKKSFVGYEPLTAQKKEGVKRQLTGFEMIDRGIPRQDCPIQKAGKEIGRVTSGSFAPSLQKNIGLGYVPAEDAEPGREIEIVIRANPLKARIVKLPFYK